MILSPDGREEDLTLETRNLRSRLRLSTPDQGQRRAERTPNGEVKRTEVLDSEQPSKRLKISPEASSDLVTTITTSLGSNTPTFTDNKPDLRDGSGALSAKEPGEVKRRTWTLPKTKRASSLNLHNHPAISHPVGIAIWLLQKIDQARKSNGSDDERSPSTSLPPSPGSIRASTEMTVSSARLDRSDSATAFSLKPSSLTGAQPLWGQSHVNEHEDDTARRQAQRHRKTKQRSENWAKNKENDVVARAKLEAKKKFGTQAQQEMERKRFVDERVRDDYGRLLGRQTTQFADALAQLAPFRVGHGEKFVESNLPHYGLHHPYVQAGKLVLDVLPALGETHVSERSQRAADALLSALEDGSPDEGSFFTFIEVLSDDEIIQRGIDKVLGQLLSARPEDRRASRSQASSAGGQLGPPPFGTSPDSVGLALKRLTWKEPTTLKDNNFAPPNNSTPSAEARVTEASGPPENLVLPPPQTGLAPKSPSVAYLTPSTAMPPPAPAQSRSSGRERKPTAKVLAASTETPSRQPTALPPVASKPASTRNARSLPRVPSKLGLSEIIADQEEALSPSTAAVVGGHQTTSTEGTSSSITTTAGQGSPPPLTRGHPIPSILPPSLQQLDSTTSSKPDLQPRFDPQLTANLLQLAEIAANMSDSDDDELEMGRPDLPYHERLIRVLGNQSSLSKWHAVSPISAEKSVRSTSLTSLLSAPHSQDAPGNAAPSQPTSLPPVNKIISAKEAQAASSFFKSLVVGEPVIGTTRTVPIPSTTTNGYARTNGGFTHTRNMQSSDIATNGTAYSGKLDAVRSSARPLHTPGPESQIGRIDSNTLSPKTQLNTSNTNRQGTVLSRVTRPEEQAALPRYTTTSLQEALLPLERKRKFEDEGNDIAMSRLRSHAESRGLVVNPNMTFDQLNRVIDNHEKGPYYNFGGVTGPTAPPVSTAPYNNIIAASGNISYSSTHPSPTMERPPSADGLRRLAPNPGWPGYNRPYAPYNTLPPRLPATHHIPAPHNFPNPDVQRAVNGHSTGTRSHVIQFLPPKQPGQFSNQSSPVVEKPPPIINGNDPRQQHQKALNGGPPGGGAVINSRTSKKQQASNTSSYKFQVNSKETPKPQSKPKRGGQLMTF